MMIKINTNRKTLTKKPNAIFGIFLSFQPDFFTLKRRSEYTDQENFNSRAHYSIV